MKKNRKRMGTVILAACVCVTSMLSGCGKEEETTSTETQTIDFEDSETNVAKSDGEPKTIKVAAAYPMSGTSAELGMMGHDGLELGIKHINDNGGIQSMGGAKIEVVWADTTSDPAQAKDVVERLVADEEILCFFGTGSSAVMMPVIPILDKNGIPAITNAGSASVTEQGSENIFQVPHSTDLGGANVMRFLQWLNEEQGYDYKKVAIVYENSTFGIDMAEGSRADAEEYGMEIVFDESFPPGLTDASAIVTAMKNSGAEVFLPATYAAESKLFLDMMKNMDYHPLVIGPVAWPSLGEGLGDSVNGVISTGSWGWNTKNVMDIPENQAIVEEFEKTYGYFMSEQAGPNYVCAQVLAATLEESQATTREELREAISKVHLTDSLICPGELMFDENGKDIAARAVCFQWQEGIPRAIFPTEYSVSAFIDPNKIQ